MRIIHIEQDDIASNIASRAVMDRKYPNVPHKAQPNETFTLCGLRLMPYILACRPATVSKRDKHRATCKRCRRYVELP